MIDAEVRASRRAVVARFRDRLCHVPETLAADDFLALVDWPTAQMAIIMAAASVADGCDLQIYDSRTKTLRIACQRGFSQAFLESFATVDASVASACGVALKIGDPVMIDDVTASPIFAGQPTLRVVLAAGSRAVHSYPLCDDHGGMLGVLSLHYRAAGRHPGQERLAWGAARAMLTARGVGPEFPVLHRSV
ncbi:GAF domain-containing protein [Actinoplanes sp. NPDC051346]|uniref:GAF domain-containing protein n=1 Tax=Actinoplanes sp. NPDC051346 TaxID=3155048 RepID=UPI003417E816